MMAILLYGLARVSEFVITRRIFFTSDLGETGHGQSGHDISQADAMR